MHLPPPSLVKMTVSVTHRAMCREERAMVADRADCHLTRSPPVGFTNRANVSRRTRNDDRGVDRHCFAILPSLFEKRVARETRCSIAQAAGCTASGGAAARGWLRSTKQGQRCRVVIASNPPVGGEGEWLSVWFAPWVDPLFPAPAAPGELRYACTRADGTTMCVPGPGRHRVDGAELVALSFGCVALAG